MTGVCIFSNEEARSTGSPRGPRDVVQRCQWRQQHWRWRVRGRRECKYRRCRHWSKRRTVHEAFIGSQGSEGKAPANTGSVPCREQI